MLNLTGRRFGRLLVTGENPSPYTSPSGKRYRRWDCVCDCGKRVTVLQNALTAKTGTRSCGCAGREKLAALGRERQNYKTCVVCGARFPCPPSTNRITCSPQCSRKRKTETHSGNGKPWDEKRRAALKERIASSPERLRQLRETAQKASDAALVSPLSGPFETNVSAKRWILKSPWGVLFEFDNLSKFVRDNPDWFPNPTSARTALSAAMKCIEGNAPPSRRHRQFSQYKGWQPIYSGEKPGTGEPQQRGDGNESQRNHEAQAGNCN